MDCSREDFRTDDVNLMEVYKVTIESPGFSDSWFYIIAKNKESASNICEEYSKPIVIEDFGVLKMKEFKIYYSKYVKIRKLPGITSSSKTEGVKVDLTDRSYSWKKS